MPIWQETERVDPRGRVTEPPSDRATIDGHLGSQDVAVRGDGPSVRAAFRHDHPRAYGKGIPAKPIGDLSGKSSSLVHRAEETAYLHDLGLELDHEEHPSPWMPGEDIDDPALAVDRERDLWLELPTVETTEQRRHRLVHRGMTGVK